MRPALLWVSVQGVVVICVGYCTVSCGDVWVIVVSCGDLCGFL